MVTSKVEFRFLVDVNLEEVDDERIKEHSEVVKEIILILDDKIGKVSRVAIVHIIDDTEVGTEVDLKERDECG